FLQDGDPGARVPRLLQRRRQRGSGLLALTVLRPRLGGLQEQPALQSRRGLRVCTLDDLVSESHDLRKVGARDPSTHLRVTLEKARRHLWTHPRVPRASRHFEDDRRALPFAAQPHGPPRRLFGLQPQPVEVRPDLPFATLGIGRWVGRPLPGKEKISGTETCSFESRSLADFFDDDPDSCRFRQASRARSNGEPEAEDSDWQLSSRSEFHRTSFIESGRDYRPWAERARAPQ